MLRRTVIIITILTIFLIAANMAPIGKQQAPVDDQTLSYLLGCLGCLCGLVVLIIAVVVVVVLVRKGKLKSSYQTVFDDVDDHLPLT